MVSVVLTWRRRAASCPGGWTAPRGAGRSPAAAFPHAPSPAHTSKSTSQPGQKQPERKSSSRKVHAVSAIPLRCEAGDAAPAPRGTPPAHHHFAQNSHSNEPTLHSGSCAAHGLSSCGRPKRLPVLEPDRMGGRRLAGVVGGGAQVGARVRTLPKHNHHRLSAAKDETQSRVRLRQHGAERCKRALCLLDRVDRNAPSCTNGRGIRSQSRRTDLASRGLQTAVNPCSWPW